MNFLIVLPTILSFLALAAHFLHEGRSVLLAAVCLLLPLGLLVRRRWVLRVFQALLMKGMLLWLWTIPESMQNAEAFGRPPERTAVILACVAGLAGLAAGLLQTRWGREAYPRTGGAAERRKVP